MNFNLTKRERLIFSATIAVIVSSITVQLFILPVVKKNNLLNSQITLTKTKLNRFIGLLGQKDELLNLYDQFYPDKKGGQLVEDKTVSIYEEIEQIALRSGIKITDIRPQPGQEAAANTEVLIELKGEGQLKDYVKFIYNLEHSLSLFKVTKFQLSVRPESQGLVSLFIISKPLL